MKVNPLTTRTAAIDKYLAELKTYIKRLEAFAAWLGSARTVAPAETDGQAFISHLLQIDETAYQLDRLANNNDFAESFFELLIGASYWPQFIEYSIKTDLMSQSDNRREIEFQRESRPAAFAHLAALYEAKYGVGL